MIELMLLLTVAVTRGYTMLFLLAILVPLLFLQS
jgi:hypothetical protein